MKATISTVLVANRGEIARRVARTARDMGFRVVAVYTAADQNAPFVREADEAVRLERSYLDGDAIIAAAMLTGTDAIHPGYGFLSENAAFANSVEDAGLVWVGPQPGVIAAMGDKLAAKRAAARADVPLLPMSDDTSDAAAAEVGFPLLVKAVAGGGGKGMRVVVSPEELADAVAAARREAASGFGDERVFLERYVPRARHVEIQILGDAYGTILHLGERECSIQRRHQKILEESPSPVMDPDMRRTMGEAAIRLAGALDYRSAGTVEFLIDDDTGEFYFLEVNTRLQVEHAVTEEVTGLDLVREQFRVARGESLNYAQEDVAFKGHAIEARLYAEDATAGFLPATGTLQPFSAAAEPAVRWDVGVEADSTVGVDFDPMLGKVIAHAPTRVEAAGRLALALERLHVGGVTTNRDFLVAILRHETFLAGDTTTDFIERVQPFDGTPHQQDELVRGAMAAALWLQGQNRASSARPHLPSGWRNARLAPQESVLALGDRTFPVRYLVRRDGSFAVGESDVARILRWTPELIDLDVNGRRRVHRVTPIGDHLHVQLVTGSVAFEILPRFEVPGVAVDPGAVTAPMSGVVRDVRCQEGDEVEEGDLLVLLEAMKMEYQVKASEGGLVMAVHVSAGVNVDLGAVMMVVQAEAGGES